MAESVRRRRGERYSATPENIDVKYNADIAGDSGCLGGGEGETGRRIRVRDEVKRRPWTGRREEIVLSSENKVSCRQNGKYISNFTVSVIFTAVPWSLNDRRHVYGGLAVKFGERFDVWPLASGVFRKNFFFAHHFMMIWKEIFK